MGTIPGRGSFGSIDSNVAEKGKVLWAEIPIFLMRTWCYRLRGISGERVVLEGMVLGFRA
jgi:hypothetical protein